MIPAPRTGRSGRRFPRLPLPLAAALTAALFAPNALADPALDRRRDALLDEMAGHLERWESNPTRPAATPAEAEDAPPAAPEDAVTDPAPPRYAARAEPAPAPLPPPAAVPHAEPLPPPATPPPPPALPKPEPSPMAAEPPSKDADPSSVDLDAPLAIGQHDAAAIAAAVLAETNAARARHGLPPVTAHPLLDQVAVEYAEHLARTGHFGHIDPSRPGLETPGDRVRAAGAPDALAAENLITETWLQVDSGERMYVIDESRNLFSRTPDGPAIPPHSLRTLAASMVKRWLESPGHRRNILDTEGRQMGFGMAWDDRTGMPSLVAVQLFQRYHRLGEGEPK